MIAPFDIFRTDGNGDLLWCDEALSLDDAKAKVQELSKSAKTSFVIRSQRTGNRIVLPPEPTSPDAGIHRSDQSVPGKLQQTP